MKNLNDVSIEECVSRVEEHNEFIHNYVINLQDENRGLRQIIKRSVQLLKEGRYKEVKEYLNQMEI